MVELLTLNQRVLGSNPSGKTMEVRRSWGGGADCKSAAFGLSRFESYHSHQWELGVDGLTRKIEALEAGVRLPEVPLNSMI